MSTKFMPAASLFKRGLIDLRYACECMGVTPTITISGDGALDAMAALAAECREMNPNPDSILVAGVRVQRDPHFGYSGKVTAHFVPLGGFT